MQSVFWLLGVDNSDFTSSAETKENMCVKLHSLLNPQSNRRGTIVRSLLAGCWWMTGKLP